MAKSMQNSDGTRYVQFEKMAESVFFLEFLAEHGEAQQCVRVYDRMNGMMAAQVSGWGKRNYESCSMYINLNSAGIIQRG